MHACTHARTHARTHGHMHTHIDTRAHTHSPAGWLIVEGTIEVPAVQVTDNATMHSIMVDNFGPSASGQVHALVGRYTP